MSGFARDTSQLSFAPIENPSFIRGRVAAGFLGGKRVAVLGELHPEVITNFELEYPIVAFEVNIGAFQTER
jgi:phenylalanyl-tRNA synthetase beta chain